MQVKRALAGALTLFLLLPGSVFAQAGFGVTQHYFIQTDSTLSGGEIISKRRGEYFLSSPKYDMDIFGVVSLAPAIELGIENKENSYPVVTAGVVEVQVNGESGPIALGDHITSSSTAGVGMKAVDTGFTLGTAQASFTPRSPEEIGRIPVEIEIKLLFREGASPSEKLAGPLTDVFNLSHLAANQDPLKTFRYVLAAGIVVGTLLLAFIMFMRLGTKGVEAAGRNPLAGRVIFTSIFLNILISLCLLGAGLAGALIFITST